MSLMHDMSIATGRAVESLGDRARLVAAFVEGCRDRGGGFRGRSGGSDLYFTVFGLWCLSVLRAPLGREAARAYLRGFAGGDGLDLVHLASLARCWAILGGRPEGGDGQILRSYLERRRCRDGGYSHLGMAEGTAYGCFLAVGAYQDLAAGRPDQAGIAHCLEALRTADGGYGNFAGAEAGSAPAAAAAMTALRQTGHKVDPDVCRWLIAQHLPSGGFPASPRTPQADLLSTAVALYALRASDTDMSGIREPCRRFVEGLWRPAGGFGADDHDGRTDCEYCFYGLLALGALDDASGK